MDKNDFYMSRNEYLLLSIAMIVIGLIVGMKFGMTTTANFYAVISQEYYDKALNLWELNETIPAFYYMSLAIEHCTLHDKWLFGVMGFDYDKRMENQLECERMENTVKEWVGNEWIHSII